MNRDRINFVRGVFLIFATYFYFLICAQFAFLELVRHINPAESYVQKIMAAMATGGLLGSFLVPYLLRRNFGAAALLRGGFAGSALAGFLAVLGASPMSVMATLIGLSVGLTTVTLATSLGSLFTIRNWAVGSALGTGLAYTAANIPLIFQSRPQIQTLCASVVALCALVAVPRLAIRDSGDIGSKRLTPHEIGFAIIFFGILVWFDSAAFYIIQHSSLKEGTWGAPSELWRNGILHLAAAVAGGLLMIRYRFLPTLAISFVLLAIGGLAANYPDSRMISGWFYPAGVSIYSACLVAFPAFGGAYQSSRGIAWIAALLYAVGGWICSGFGIGMAQNLGRIPLQFVTLSAIALSLPLLWTSLKKLRRELTFCALVIAAAACATLLLRKPPAALSTLAQGRSIYISEGCVNCHSQFVKPGSRDELLWGPTQSIEAFTKEAPPLFGNRRQGPDLMNIGNRRSRDWLKLHFIAPRKLAPGSSMPSYDYLCEDGRGEVLIDYLLSLKGDIPRETSHWKMNTNCLPHANSDLLFRQHCAACHDLGQQTASYAVAFKRRPPNLLSGPFVYAPHSLPSDLRRMQIARIIKFGIAGTDMPGHEYFSDETVFALTRFIEQQSNQ
jgi:mono/diheme cytochrome c family protein